MPHSHTDQRPSQRTVRPLSLVAALAVCLIAPAFFVAEVVWLGIALAAGGLALAWWESRRALSSEPSLLRDLALIVVGLAIVRTIPLAAELDNMAMVRFTLALGGAVVVPYLISRFVYRERAISFPWRGGGRWRLRHWLVLISVPVAAWLILPGYFISTGVYQNWPDVNTPDLIGRLFVGVGAVGIWDELFFICTVFALLRRHFPTWLANGLQTIVFVSFLWELGYRSWGPILTIPFALLQGFIFVKSRSLAFVVTIHLIFDAVVFAVLVHAHNPELFAIFPLIPGS